MKTKFTLYLSVTSLDEIADRVASYMTTHNLQNHPIVRMEIDSGLPHNDYGQTVIVYYESEQDGTQFPAYETKYKNKALVGA